MNAAAETQTFVSGPLLSHHRVSRSGGTPEVTQSKLSPCCLGKRPVGLHSPSFLESKPRRESLVNDRSLMPTKKQELSGGGHKAHPDNLTDARRTQSASGFRPSQHLFVRLCPAPELPIQATSVHQPSHTVVVKLIHLKVGVKVWCFTPAHSPTLELLGARTEPASLASPGQYST